MIQEQDSVLVDLRIAVARLEEQVKVVNVKLDVERETDRAYREQMDAKLAPLVDNMNKGKGALAAATLVAGALGAGFATAVKHFFGVTT
jgi:hypothetical protein